MSTNGESLEAQAETFMTKQLDQLTGYTVIRPVFVNVGYPYKQVFGGLELGNQEGRKMVVWFLRDEEDNGAGYFDIQRVL